MNQLARARELDVHRLAKAGEQLEQTQREAVTGGGAEGFVEARRAEQAALERLVREARAVLRDAGHSPSDATIDRVATTLRAAAVTEEGRDLLKRGRLVEDLQPQGFEAFRGVPLLPPRAKPRERRPAPRAPAAQPPERKAEPARPRRDQRRLEEARAAEREARAEARKLDREAQDAERRAAQAERTADAARRAAAAARSKADRASSRADALAEKAARLTET